jgi:hypothetical protein
MERRTHSSVQAWAKPGAPRPSPRKVPKQPVYFEKRGSSRR